MRKQRSIGEMISTVTFFGLSAYLLIFSLGLLEEGEKLRGDNWFAGSGLLRPWWSKICDC
jgi:hypothetical protein